jgi:molybdopterin-guanine dinucleotide biosynthesis protein
MKIVAVVGSGSGCGKTTLVCRILRKIPGLGAVKLSPRDAPARVEWGRGERGKDTDRYAECGASQVARIVGLRDEFASLWGQIEQEFSSCRGVVVEGSRSLDLPGERFVVFVSGAGAGEIRKDRERELESISTVVVRNKFHFPDKKCQEIVPEPHYSIFPREQNNLDELASSLDEDQFIEALRLFIFSIKVD